VEHTSGSMTGHHGLSTRKTLSAETKDHHLKTDCTVSGNTLLGEKKESVWTWELTIYLSASYSGNQGIIPSYISHMFVQRKLGLYRPRMHPPKYSAIHNIIIVCVCLQGKQQENNNDQNYTFLTLFKDLSIMVIDNCNFAFLYTRR